MAGYKGVGVVFVRRAAREAGLLDTLTARRSLDDRFLLEACTAGAWVPIEFAVRVAEAAAPLLHPQSSSPLFELGRALARDNLSGVYAFLVRLLTPAFLFKQTARLWSTYHQAGHASTHVLDEGRLRFTIADYPTLPASFLEYNRGFLAEAVALTGAQIVITLEPSAGGTWSYVADRTAGVSLKD